MNPTLHLWAIALLASLFIAHPLSAADDKEIFAAGKAAFEAQEYELAHRYFSILVRKYPSNQQIRYYFQNAKLKASSANRGNLESQQRA